MPDSPDYQKYLPNSNRFSLQDMGELAARLGSVNVFDRRGETVFYETFDHGLSGWITNISGVGSSVSISASHIHRHPYTAKLVCGTTGNKFALIQKRVGGINTKRVGLEVCWCLNLGDNLIICGLDVNDGVTNFSGAVDFNGVTNIWRVQDENGVMQPVFTKPMEVGNSFIFIPVKIVMDVETGYYVRLLISDDNVDISNLKIKSQAVATAINYSALIENLGDGSTLTELYVAHIIITANEL